MVNSVTNDSNIKIIKYDISDNKWRISTNDLIIVHRTLCNLGLKSNSSIDDIICIKQNLLGNPGGWPP